MTCPRAAIGRIAPRAAIEDYGEKPADSLGYTILTAVAAIAFCLVATAYLMVL